MISRETWPALSMSVSPVNTSPSQVSLDLAVVAGDSTLVGILGTTEHSDFKFSSSRAGSRGDSWRDSLG